jgi:hypothetical protein
MANLYQNWGPFCSTVGYFVLTKVGHSCVLLPGLLNARLVQCIGSIPHDVIQHAPAIFNGIEEVQNRERGSKLRENPSWWVSVGEASSCVNWMLIGQQHHWKSENESQTSIDTSWSSGSKRLKKQRSAIIFSLCQLMQLSLANCDDHKSTCMLWAVSWFAGAGRLGSLHQLDWFVL